MTEPKFEDLSAWKKFRIIAYIAGVFQLVLWVALPVVGLLFCFVYEAWQAWYWFLHEAIF
jgi:hypothetical protein